VDRLSHSKREIAHGRAGLCLVRFNCSFLCREAQQDLGYVLDVYFEDFDRAEQAFKAAIELGAGSEGYCGLARVLAQMGRTDDAILSLSEGMCPFHNQADTQALRTEITAGDWHGGR
jgi:hypothetical protein